MANYTRGMSQFVDGGNRRNKPYVSSSELHRQDDYCGSCFIKAIKTGEKPVRLIVCTGISMIKMKIN
jgi:deoxyribodipyrimidine photolyase-like uncharacterized protein